MVDSTTEEFKVMRFDEKAVTFLEEMRVKLGLKDINQVVATSFDLLKMLDHLHENTDCQLVYMNEKNEIFPVSLYDSEINKGALNSLKDVKDSGQK